MHYILVFSYFQLIINSINRMLLDIKLNGAKRWLLKELAQWVDLGSIPGCVVPKTLKMVLDTSLLNTQRYKVCIKGKVEQSRERNSAHPYTLGVVAIEKGAFWSPSTTAATFTYMGYLCVPYHKTEKIVHCSQIFVLQSNIRMLLENKALSNPVYNLIMWDQHHYEFSRKITTKS